MTNSEKRSAIQSHSMIHLAGPFVKGIPAAGDDEHSYHITANFGQGRERGNLVSIRNIPDLNKKAKSALANLFCAIPEMRNAIQAYLKNGESKVEVRTRMAAVIKKFNLISGSKMPHLKDIFGLAATMSSDFQSIRYISADLGEDKPYKAIATVPYGAMTSQDEDLATAALFALAPAMRDAILAYLKTPDDSPATQHPIEEQMRSALALN